MELISSAFLGSIQGLTEFLPISSSGHIELISNIFDLSKPDITFDIFVHFGSLLAILLFFKFNYSQSVASDVEIIKNKKIIALSFIPIGIIGLFFRDFLNNESREIAFIGAAFIFSGIIICLHFLKKLSIGFFYIVLIASLFQAFAALPGVSRSGMVIGISVLLGLSLRRSIILSFLMSVPLIFISSFYEIFNLLVDGFSQFDIFYLIIGFIFSFFASFFGIKIMIYLSNFVQLRIFGFYNILLGIFILLFSAL